MKGCMKGQAILVIHVTAEFKPFCCWGYIFMSFPFPSHAGNQVQSVCMYADMNEYSIGMYAMCMSV